MRIFFFLLAISPAFRAAPFDELGDDITLYSWPQMLGRVLEASPQEVKDLLEDSYKVSQEEARKLVEVLPAYVKKHNIIITTKTLPGVLRDLTPSIFKKYENLTTILKAKFNRLSKPTQAFVTNSVNEVDAGLIYYQKDLKGNFSRLNDESVARKTSIRLFHILRNIVQYLEANPKAKVEIAKQWPNYGLLMNSPWYDYLLKMAKIDEKQIEPLVNASFEYKKRHYGDWH